MMKNIVCSDLYMPTLQGMEKRKWVAARSLLANSGCQFAHGVDAFDLRRTTAGVYDKWTRVRMNTNPLLLDVNDPNKYAFGGIHEFQDVLSPLIFTSDDHRPSELFSSMMIQTLGRQSPERCVFSWVFHSRVKPPRKVQYL